MGISIAKLTMIVIAATLAACGKKDRTTQLPPMRLLDAESKGRDFRETLIKQWKTLPSEVFTDFSELCRTTFIGTDLQYANATMRAAGQGADLMIVRQPASLIPPGTTSYGGGIGLHSSLISGVSFNIVMYVSKASTVESAFVADVSCSIRDISL